MEKALVELEEMKLVVMTCCTNNRQEMDPGQSKIANRVQMYFQNNLGETITSRVNPGRTLSCYMEYESDHTGDYTYVIGEQVSAFENIPEEFTTVTIPAQKYAKFTTGPAPMPGVVINAWQAIWTMTDEDFGGKRNYQADFEVYDQRAADPSQAVVDIFIGIR